MCTFVTAAFQIGGQKGMRGNGRGGCMCKNVVIGKSKPQSTVNLFEEGKDLSERTDEECQYYPLHVTTIIVIYILYIIY